MAGARAETVTVLFTDVVGSTSWRVRVGGAVADAESIELERAIREVVVSSGGEVVKGLGDGVMAIFRGATAALDAAVTMRAVASGLAIGGAESGLRIGISSGDLLREQGDWVGTAAIEASRLCGEAGGSGALVADSTVRLCRGHAAHELHPLGPRVLRGFAEAVDVYELVAGQDDGPSLPAALGYVATSPLVGRAAELARASAELARLKTGGSTTLFIVGEPGVGKTRFAAEIAAMALADHSTVLYGRCDEGRAEPYQPISAAFGRWLESCPVPVLTRTIGSIGGDLTALWPDLGSRLPLVMPPAELDPESRRWRLLEAVAALGRAIAASRPLILVLDDVHWAEPSTSLLLGHLVRRAIPGLAIVATVRRAEAGQRPSTMLGDVGTTRQPKVIDLAGLDEPEVSAFVTLHVGHRPPPALAKQLYRTTDGNPFFLGALLAHLASTVSLRTADGTWLDVAELAAAGVPDDIRGVIERRLAILPPAARRALDVAAVIGLAFDELTVRGASSTPLEESVDALDAAIAAGLVRETRAGRFTFVHALVRQTVLDDLSQTRRARLHWRVAEQLEGVGYADRAPSEIAHHYAAGVDVGDPDTVVRWTVAAADEAMTGTAFDEAAGHLRTALAALDRMAPDLARRYGILRSLGQALNALADYRGSGEAWLAAADLARQLGDPDRLFGTVVGYGYVVRVDGDDQLVRMLDDVLALAGPDDSAVRACALGWRAVPALSTGGLRSTSGDREMVEAAVRMAERTGDRSAVAATLRSRLLLLARSGDAAGMLRDAKALAEAGPVGGVTITRDTAASLRDHAAALLRVGRRSDAERQVGLAKAEAGRNGLRMAMGSALILESAMATASGRFGDGKRLAARAVNESQPDNVVTQLVYAGQIVAARMEQGRLTEVIDGLRQFQGLGLVAPAWSAMLATALAEDGDTAEAAIVLASIDDSLERGPDDFAAPMTLRHLAESCRLLGDQQRARVLLPHAEAWAGQMLIVPYGTSIEGASDRTIGHLLALLGRLDEADAAYERGAALERSMEFPPLVARTMYWRACALLERDRPGDHDRATALLREAIEIAGQLGMSLLTARASAASSR